MTVEERDTVLETVDILRTLGGNNGFSNLQPKLKKMLRDQANKLKEIVDNDIKRGNSFQHEVFEGETVYGKAE